MEENPFYSTQKINRFSDEIFSKSVFISTYRLIRLFYSYKIKSDATQISKTKRKCAIMTLFRVFSSSVSLTLALTLREVEIKLKIKTVPESPRV